MAHRIASESAGMRKVVSVATFNGNVRSGARSNIGSEFGNAPSVWTACVPEKNASKALRAVAARMLTSGAGKRRETFGSHFGK